MRFEDTRELKGAQFVNADLADARFQNVDLTGARFREAMLVKARISGLIDGLTVNDVEVAPLIEAELNRRYPERAALRPEDAAGAREAWRIVSALWDRSLARAGSLPEAMLY